MLKEGKINHYLLRDALTYGMSGKWGYGDFLGKYCSTVGPCTASAVTRFLSKLAFKVKFYQRKVQLIGLTHLWQVGIIVCACSMLLPETDFGTFLAQTPGSTYDDCKTVSI